MSWPEGHFDERTEIQKAYDEAKHPRDAKGRWSSGGGGAEEPAGKEPEASPGSRTKPSVMRAASKDRHQVEIERFGEGMSLGTVYKAQFADGTHAAYKPAAGNGYMVESFDENDNEIMVPVRKTIDSTVPQMNRELATMQVDRALGFNRVPHVETVDYGKGIGHAQAWVDGEVARSLDMNTVSDATLQGKSMQQLAALDFIIGNTDRHAGNFMLGKDSQWYAIDNGLTFPDSQRQFKSIPVQALSGGHVAIDADVLAGVKSLSPQKLRDIMTNNGMGSEAIRQAQGRLKWLQGSKNWFEAYQGMRMKYD